MWLRVILYNHVLCPWGCSQFITGCACVRLQQGTALQGWTYTKLCMRFNQRMCMSVCVCARAHGVYAHVCVYLDVILTWFRCSWINGYVQACDWGTIGCWQIPATLKPCPVRRKCVNVFVKQKNRSCSGKSKSGKTLSPSLSLSLTLSPSLFLSPGSQPLSGVVPSHLSPLSLCFLLYSPDKNWQKNFQNQEA